MITRSKSMNSSLGRWAPAVFWMAFIFFLSSRSSFPDLGVKPLVEKALRIAGHFIQYAVLAFLVSRANAPNGERSNWRIGLVLAWCAAYAVSDEWHQSFVPGRDASAFDWGVDMLGTLFGCAVCVARMKV
ncbi:MAG: VanZ family protein [Longimicrobiales bacterium]